MAHLQLLRPTHARTALRSFIRSPYSSSSSSNTARHFSRASQLKEQQSSRPPPPPPPPQRKKSPLSPWPFVAILVVGSLAFRQIVQERAGQATSPAADRERKF